MSKVLRIYESGSNTITDWGNSSKIGATQIESIVDGTNMSPKHEITSIPSPFARIDLAKSAFNYVARKDEKGKSNVIGNTAYHKIVSDCLDVAQIFFEIEKYRDFIEVIVWDKNAHLKELENSDISGHKMLADTYRKFLTQDAHTYHFDKMDKIYLLNYKAQNAPGQINIIGATSPATLFFTPANDLSYVGQNVDFGNDKPFDGTYKALHQRNFDFVKFMWSIRRSFPNFAAVFNEVDRYMDAVFEECTPSQKQELAAIDQNYYNAQYTPTAVVPDSQNYVRIHDFVLGHRSQGRVNSGFEMIISKDKNIDHVPLALPVDPISDKVMYVLDYWHDNYKAPVRDSKPLAQRTLPYDGSKYPYVTISDFLEDTITRMPYGYNSDKFFDGNFKGNVDKVSYLLPLKQLYFDYFNINDLMGNFTDNRNQSVKRIEIESVGNDAVKVTLRIPIKSGGYIQYSRIYAPGSIVDDTMGRIIDAEFTLAHYPLIKYPKGVMPKYKIAIVEDSTKEKNNFNISFFDANNERVSHFGEPIYRNRSVGGSKINANFADPAVYVLEKEYEYMHISNEDNLSIRGVVIPKFEEKHGDASFKFAIDFGTTNTHIEYNTNTDQTPKAFEITKDDIQLHKLHKDEQLEAVINYQVVFNGDMMPSLIGGNNSEYVYPMRTVLLESRHIENSGIPMANVNIPFIYERKKLPSYNNPPFTNIKWSDDPKHAEAYIKSILMILRNKVLLGGGNLAKTQIVWFYPASMSPGRFARFNETWRGVYKEIFGGKIDNVQTMSESMAPYLYNKTNEGATSTVVSVDIGGGTTDVLIAVQGEPQYITSFGFAADTIWGDGYAYNAKTNGFIKKYKPIFDDKVTNGELKVIKAVYEELLGASSSSASTDIIAFFFSLLSNKELASKKIKVDFGEMLSSDKRCNYIILLFYTAIMYHVAQVMKAKQIAMPRHITFSGNGSKVLNILTTEISFLENYTKKIFEGVYGNPYSEDGLRIIRPGIGTKESTCKGGIIAGEDFMRSYDSIKGMKTVLVGCDDKTFVEGLTYDDIDDVIKNKIKVNVDTFIDFFFNLNEEYSFADYFNVDNSIMDRVKDICKKDVGNYLSDGLHKRVKSNLKEGAVNRVEETLFFYPLVGIINAVARQIYELK